MTTMADAFGAASGVSAEKLSLAIRTAGLALVFIWAGWCSLSLLHHVREHGVDEASLALKIFRILFIVSISIVLFFVS